MAAVIPLAAIGGWLLVPRLFGGNRRPNVILISMDTCRADYLSCYGFPQKTTPNLDALAGEGFLFRHVITPVPTTLPAHCSMLTGTDPPYHGVHGNHAYRLHDSNVTLAELLKPQGYRTAAVVGAFVLDAQFGLSQGFEHYDDALGEHEGASAMVNERRGEEVTRAALAWVQSRAAEPFFLFLHYYDPHYPYVPPAPFSDIFPDQRYAGEIAYTDQCIGNLFTELKRLEIYDQSLIIVTADHGEGLNQHGESTHSFFIYHSTTSVPLLIKLPGANTPRVIEEKVGLIDLVPTVLDYLQIPTPDVLHGASLTPYFTGHRPPGEDRVFYSETLAPTLFDCNSLLAMENERWKYIQTTRPELYNLLTDSGEENNVAEERRTEAGRLREQLRDYLQRITRVVENNAAVADETVRRRIEELGYVSGGTPESLAFADHKEDPKDFLPLFAKITEASEFMHRRPFSAPRFPEEERRRKAKQLLSEVVEARPDNLHAHTTLARLAREEGDYDQAARHYDELIRIDPQSASARHDLANVRMAQGRRAEALELYEQAVKLGDAAGESSGTFDQALQRLARTNPVRYEARFALGDAWMQDGQYEKAAERYREVLALPSTSAATQANTHYRIGLTLERLDRADEAKGCFRKALELQPDHAGARQELDRVEPQTTSP